MGKLTIIRYRLRKGGKWQATGALTHEEMVSRAKELAADERVDRMSFHDVASTAAQLSCLGR